MRVLLISPLAPPAGGIATWTELYLKSNISLEYEICLINTSIIGKRIQNSNKIYIFNEIKRTSKIFHSVKSELENKDILLAHINNSCSVLGMIRDLLLILLMKHKRIKIVTHFHCDTNYMVNNSIKTILFRGICNNSDVLLCLNDSSKKHILETTNKVSFKIPNFFDINTNLKNVNRKINNEIKNILYAGNISKLKGFEEIIQIARNFNKINFNLIGSLNIDANKYNLPNNVHLLGVVSRDEVYKFMFESDLLLFPSHTEGFSNVVLEAMASGLPIIASNVGAISDMIENKGGYIVKVGDVENFIAGIEIIKNRNTRIKMSDWNIKKVEENYSVARIAKTLLDVYKQLEIK